MSLCLRDRTYERVSRLPVQVEMLGRTVEPPCRSAILGEYRGTEGEAFWLLAGDQCARAWRARRIEDHELECWGSAEPD